MAAKIIGSGFEMKTETICANCNEIIQRAPSRIKRNKTRLAFCDQDCWIEYRTLHSDIGADGFNILNRCISDWYEPLKQFLTHQPVFIRSRDITPLFSEAHPDFCQHMSAHAKSQQMGKMLMVVCEPWCGNVKSKHVNLFKNPYAVKNRGEVKV